MPVHGIDNGNNKHEVYTTEELLSILQQAINSGSLQGIDPTQTPIVAAVRESHNNSDVTFWSGTEAEFNELTGVTSELIGARIGSDGKLYLLSGDTTLSDTIQACYDAALEATEGMKREVISVTLMANAWSDTAPYTQTVAVAGMTADKDFLAPYLEPTGNESDDLAAQVALSCISGGTTDTDSVTFYCYDEKPTTTITVFMVDKGTKLESSYPVATQTTLGVVKIGDGLEIGQDGKVSAANLAEGLSNMEQELETLPTDEESEILLYAFFDDSNNVFNYYVSEDGIKLRKIKTSSNTVNTGADPSLLYKNGKFYMAYTNQSSTYDFSIKVSEDLNTWEQYDIDCGLYDATYTKRWAPEWFEDDNGKIYIVISKQYAATEGWGDFRQWIVECTNLDNLIFGTPQQMVLNGATADNHIDGTIAKYNGVYHMIVKSDHQTEVYQEYYTSSDLINWTLQSVDPCRFGRGTEGTDIVAFNDKFYIYTEHYNGRALSKSYQLLSTTSDFQTFTNPVDVAYPDEDLSHGGGVVIPKKVINKLLANGNITLEDEDKSLANIPCEKSFHAVATRLTDDNTNTGNRLGNYLHLFDISGGSAQRRYNVQFHISSATSNKIDAEYSLTAVLEGNGVTSILFNEVYCSTRYASTGTSLAGHMIAVKDASDSSKVGVYINLQTAPLNSNEAINISFLNEENWFAKVVKYTDNFADTIDLSSNKYVWANGSANSRTTLLDIAQNTKARITFACRNSSVDVWGNINRTTADRILNGKILVNGGYVAYKNFNEDLASEGKAITVTLENYDSTKNEYTILIENIPQSSSFGLTIPATDRSYIKSTTLLA